MLEEARLRFLSRHELLRYPLSVPVLVATVHAAQFLSAEEAQRALSPTVDGFQATKFNLSPEQLRQIEVRSRTRMRLGRFCVWSALAHGERIKVVIVDEVCSKHEFITNAMAIDGAGKIVGVEILPRKLRRRRGARPCRVTASGWLLSIMPAMRPCAIGIA